MQQDDASEKTEAATPHKLEEAKRRGSVYKSQEVVNVLTLVALGVYVVAMGQHSFLSLLTMMKEMFMFANGSDSMLVLHQVGQRWLPVLVNVLGPFVILLMAVGILGSVAQTHGVFSFFPLKPDLAKINPIKGIKNLISKKVLFEIFKSLLKLVLLVVVLYLMIFRNYAEYAFIFKLSESDYINRILDIGLKYLTIVVVGLAFLAMLDFMFGRGDFLAKMRMSRKELKDEAKKREGDPLIKSKRRSLEKELRKRSQSISSVRSADVVITNPTHYAIVLKYDRGTMIAPKVVGKGADDLALAIRLEALRFSVPVFESPTIARTLYRFVSIDACIREKDYVDVARILKKAYQKRESSAGVKSA